MVIPSSPELHKGLAWPSLGPWPAGLRALFWDSLWSREDGISTSRLLSAQASWACPPRPPGPVTTSQGWRPPAVGEALGPSACGRGGAAGTRGRAPGGSAGPADLTGVVGPERCPSSGQPAAPLVLPQGSSDTQHGPWRAPPGPRVPAVTGKAPPAGQAPLRPHIHPALRRRGPCLPLP